LKSDDILPRSPCGSITQTPCPRFDYSCRMRIGEEEVLIFPSTALSDAVGTYGLAAVRAGKKKKKKKKKEKKTNGKTRDRQVVLSDAGCNSKSSVIKKYDLLLAAHVCWTATPSSNEGGRVLATAGTPAAGSPGPKKHAWRNNVRYADEPPRLKNRGA